MANSVLASFRRQHPGDQRSDDEINQYIAQAFPQFSDASRFPDFHADLARLTQATEPQPGVKGDFAANAFPPLTAGDYAKQALGSGIRGITSTLGSIPESVASAAKIAGVYSLGLENVPQYSEVTPGFIESALPRLGEALSPQPVPGLEKSFLATTLPSFAGAGAGFVALGGAAGALERSIVSRIGVSAAERAAAAGLAEADATAVGVGAAQTAATRLSYGNIGTFGALSQAQQGYSEAEASGADEETRFKAFALNLPVGATFAVPLGNILSRLNTLSEGTLKQYLLAAGIHGFEGALVNGLIGGAGDVIASRIAKYEPDRKIFGNLAEQAAGGGIAAAVLSLATSAIGGKLRTPTTRQTPPTPGAPGETLPGTAPVTPVIPAAPDVAAQYASPEQRAQEHAATMLATARAQIFGPFGKDEIDFVAKLPPNEMLTYQGMVEQARKEKDATDQGIEQRRVEEEHRRNDELLRAQEEDRQRQAAQQGARAADSTGGGVQPAADVGLTSDSPPGTGGQPAVAPEKGIVPPPPVVPITPPVGLPPALEAIARKVASPTGQLTADEIAVLPKATDSVYALFHQRVAELNGVPVAVTPPVEAPVPTRPPLPSPVRQAAAPTPVGVVGRARAKAVALATVLKRKAAAVVHASPILDTIDFEGNAPLTFELSGQGVGERTREAPLDPTLALVSKGIHQGQQGNIVKETDTYADIKLKNGDVIRVANEDYKTAADIRKEMQEGKGGQTTVAPAYFELPETPASNDKALQGAGLVSLASVTGKVDHGSRNSWTHRWTVFRNENRIYFLPTYKSGGTIMAMEAGKKKGTPVVDLMKRGYTPIASYRAEKAQHAAEAPKPVLGADEYERTFASHARERMAAGLRTAAATAEAMAPTKPVATEGTEETVTGTEPSVGPVLPVEITFSKDLAHDMFSGLTEALAKSPQESLSVSDEATLETIAKYAMKGKYGKEIRDTAIELARELGERNASRAIIGRIVDGYNNSRTSEEFAAALSKHVVAGAIQPALAAGGIGGPPGVAVNRPERGTGEPGAAVPPAPQNAGVAPGTEPGTQRSQPKFFQPSAGGYATVERVRAKFQDLLDAWANAGVDVSVVQGHLIALGNEIGGAQLGNRIVLAMSDVTRPASENLTAAVHETVHWLAELESPEMQARLHRAVDALSDVRLGLPPDIVAHLADPRIDPEVRVAERLAYSLQAQGIDAIAARGWGQRIIRALKDVWYRATMAIQEGFTGGTNPERVLAYFRNRLNSFLAGDQTPLSFINFLGGGKPSIQRKAQFYTAVSDGSGIAPVTFDWDTGTVRHGIMVPSTVDAAVFNIRNAVREGWKFMEMEPVFAGEKIGGENPTVRAGPEIVSAKEMQGMLERAYVAFGAHAATTPFHEFVGILKGDNSLPADIIAGVHAELDAIGAPHPNPDLSIDGPVSFNNDATKQQARAMALLTAKSWFSNANAVFAEATSKISGLVKESARKIAKHETLALKFADLTVTLDAAKDSLRSMIDQTKTDIRAFIRDAKLIGMLTQSLKEFQANVNDPVPAHYEAVIDKMATRLLSDADHFTDFLQDAAALDINWHGLTMPQIKEQLRALLSTNPLFSGLSVEDQNVALSLVGAFARSNDHHMAWLAVRASNDHEAIVAIRAMLAEARKGGTENLNRARDMAVNKIPRKAAHAQRILTAYTQALKDAQSVIAEQHANNKALLVHAAAAPVLQQAINDLERPLTARKLTPTSVVDGAALPYVASATSTLAEIEAADPWIAHLSGEQKRTPAETQAMWQRYDAWVLAHETTGGAMVETLKDLSKQLKLIDASKQQVALRQSLLARAVGTMSDAMRGTGTLAGTRWAERYSRYTTLQGTHTFGPNGLVSYGTRVEAAKARAQRLLGKTEGSSGTPRCPRSRSGRSARVFPEQPGVAPVVQARCLGQGEGLLRSERGI